MADAFFKLTDFKKHKLDFSSGISLFVLLCFVLGYISATVTVSSQTGAVFNFAESSLQSDISTRDDLGFLLFALSSLLKFLPFLLAVFLFGTSIVGAVVIPAVSVLFGFAESAVISVAYASYGISGIGFAALVIAPAVIFKAYILILASRESVCFSRRVLLNSVPHGTSCNLFRDFKVYLFRYAFLLVLSLFAALADAATTALFFDYFNF